jgi:hypothetical protein
MAIKKRKEADRILQQISEFQRTKTGFNPCDDPANLRKYPRVRQACKLGAKQEAAKVEAESKKTQAEGDKQIAELLKGATSDTTQAAAPAQGAAAPAQTSAQQPEGDMTKYLVIGGVGLLLIGGVAFFLLRKPSAAPAPAK